ncbi:hypothetical protein PLICRDRAFT_134009 [Plicaturopsis crispa FD-325 SS-3]|nr:hypothetical protein PLICRDRAFT_134009 [Plicaturopsis crispa FD-325 SS-3]
MDYKATLPLKFVVIGASIAGLSCAYSLRRAGHNVLVLEANDGKYRSHGGMRVPPNMTRILNDWGLGDALKKVAIQCPEFIFRSGATGEPVGILKLHRQMMEALNAEFVFVQHGDLHTLLYNLAVDAGVEIKYDTPVDKVDPYTATAFSSNGSTYSGDVIIGADGHRSMVRNVVLGSQIPSDRYGKRVSFDATVRTDIMKQDPDLLALTESAEWFVWMGNNASAYGHLIHGGEEFGLNVTLTVEDEDAWEESWTDRISLYDPKYGLEFPLFDPRVHKLLKLAETATPTKYIIREPFETWVHEAGKVALVGEAAHPIMPSSTHNAAMGVEDAATLGALFSRLSNEQQIPMLLSAYEEIREPRCSETQQSEHQNREFLCIPNGPEQQARDDGLRETIKHSSLDWDDADEEFLKATYESYIVIFAYDAGEMADDWWTKWGNMLDRGTTVNQSFGASAFQNMQVSVSSTDS